jgi:hypothetical protein
MSGDDDDGAYDPYAPRQPRSSAKQAGRKPGLRVVSSTSDARAVSPAGTLDDVAAAIKEAEGGDARLSLGFDDPTPGHHRDGMRPGEWKPDEYGLPPDCPVLPLGTDNGMFFFLDTIGQMRALKDSELSQAGINALFMGRHLYLYWAWPKKNKDGDVTSWRPEKVRETLTGACARKGPWNSADRVRGRGTWRGRDGRLIIHCGDRLFSAAGEESLGELEGSVYPTRPPIARPWPVSLAGKPGPALRLHPHFQTWQWVRPELDPVLLIGQIGVGMLGGALDWRPAGFILGDKATGKSSLQRDLKALQGAWLVQSADTTAAGIWQRLQFDCLPVAVDEFEAKADTRKQKAVIELARLSASGAPMMRGGDNHKGTEFQGRSSFLFSSINTPPLDPQDLSRMAILRLSRLQPGKAKPVIPDDELAELGRKMLRRLMDNWHRWPATFAAWREFLAGCGHDGRGQDTFGTLMAVADLVIDHDAEALGLEIGPNAENFERWRPLLEASTLWEYEDATENWRLCLSHLLSKRIEAWRGGTRHTVGEVIAEFWEGFKNPDALGYTAARKLLEQTGLTITKPTTAEEHFSLLVPNQHPLLHELFKDSKWQGELSAGTWAGALRQAPPEIWREASARINAEKKKGIAFALKDIIASDEDAQP